MADVGAQVFKFFRQRGYSPAAAAGIVGNFQQESSLRPDAAGGGIDQGQGARYHPGSLQQQLAGILGELQGSERGTAQAIKGASDPRKAARIFSQRFERPGEPLNEKREQYAAEALKRYGGINPQQLAQAAVTGSGPQLQTTTAQGGDPEALAQALAEVKRMSGPSVLAAGASPARPTFAAGSTAPEGAKAPTPLSPAPEKQPQLQQLLEAALGGQTQTSSVGPGTHHAQAYEEAGGSGGAYVNPLPGFTKGRTDQGVDYSAHPGAPIRAIGDGVVLPGQANWFQGQPYVQYRLTNGPQKGKTVFVAEQITPQVKPGQHVRAGQRIGVYAPSGTAIETGFGSGKPGVPIDPYAGRPDGTETGGGKQARRFLERLGAR